MAEQAESISWSEPFTEVLIWANPPFARWFVDGKLNVAYNRCDLLNDDPRSRRSDARVCSHRRASYGGVWWVSADALGSPIEACDAKAVITADGGYRRGPPFALKATVDEDPENLVLPRRCRRSLYYAAPDKPVPGR
jgi:acyl-coenzyme A synthetase/AMP-(fatty) acid ligase